MVKDRENDIRFHDKTENDQKVATMVTDFITCIDNMGDLAIEAINKNGNSDGLIDDFNRIMEENGLTTTRTGEKRKYQDLIKNRFKLEVKCKIERKDDFDTISNKVFDFSSKTISRLIKEGIHDVLGYLVEKDRDDKVCSPKEAREHIEKFIKGIEEPTIDEEIYMINSAKEKLNTL